MKSNNAKEYRKKESVRIKTDIAARAMAKNNPDEHAKWHMQRRPYGIGKKSDEEQKNESV